ncbi:hypothetical protein DVH02_18170, partial [Streptomyces corynorhini]
MITARCSNVERVVARACPRRAGSGRAGDASSRWVRRRVACAESALRLRADSSQGTGPAAAGGPAVTAGPAGDASASATSTAAGVSSMIMCALVPL